MRLSAAGLAALASEEGLRLVPYNDSAGHATIGVGHLIHHGPVTAADRAKYRGFTRADAFKLLASDVASREADITRLCPGANQNEFDALVSLLFNIGIGNFSSSTVLREWRAGDKRACADAFLMWKVGGAGLLNRRKRERARFLTPAKNPDGYRLLPRAEHQVAHKIEYHRDGALKAPKGSKLEAKHARWREHYKRAARVLMRAIQVAARAPGRGGWGHKTRKGGLTRGARFQLLERAVDGKP